MRFTEHIYNLMRIWKFCLVFFGLALVAGTLGRVQAQDVNSLNSVSQKQVSQEDSPRMYPWKEDPPKGTPGLHKGRFFTGGGIGAQFGSITAVELAPMVGYIPHRMVRFGLAVNFSYYRASGFNGIYKDYFWGGNFFLRFYPIQRLFLHVEIGAYNQEYGTDRQRKWMFYPLAGIGYNQPISQRLSFHIKLLWNFNDSEYSIYGNPIIGFGFDVGL